MENLRDLYLQDLGKTVTYGDKNPRQRVRHLHLWEGIQSTYQNQPFDLHSFPKEKIWVWSDQHFGHKNIIRFCDRPYTDLDIMSQSMIENYQSVVQPDDVCIWVGDVGFQADSLLNEIIHQLNGYKILVVGNHDFNKKKLRKLHFDEIHLLHYFSIEDIDYVFTHYPMENLPKPMINIHGHIHNNENLANIQNINVSVEVIDYTPINLLELHKTIGRSRFEALVDFR